MPSPTSNEPFELLIDYLQGKINADQLRTAFTDNGQIKNAFDVYKNTNFSAEQKTQLKKELTTGSSNTNATINNADNLLDLIDNLNKAGYGHGQLADFRYQLKKIKPKADWTGTLYLTTLLTGIISSFFLLSDRHRERLEAVLLRVAPFIAPFLLVGFQFYTIIRQAYISLYEDTYHSYEHRIQRWLVGTLPSLLNLAAYATIAVVGSMSPIAALLFVAASLVAVADGAYRFYHRPTTEELAEPGTAAAIRQENRKKRTGQTLEVKIYAAVALAVTVVVSCVFPPSIFVVLAYSALFILIPWTKNSFLNKIHTESSDQLQKDLYAHHGFVADDKSEIDRLQSRIQELESELQNHNNPRVTVTHDSAPPSRAGLFKPAMLNFSEQSSTEIEASAWSPHLETQHPVP